MPMVADSEGYFAAKATQAALEDAVVAIVTTRDTPAACARSKTSGKSPAN